MGLPLTAPSRQLLTETGAALSEIRIALFDDHPPVRDLLAVMLGRQSGIQVIATGQSADEAIVCAGSLMPDVILLDISMAGDGIAAAQKIFLSCPAVRTIMLTSFDDAHLISAALCAGARAFLVKGKPVSEIAEAIRAVHAGVCYLPPSLAARLLDGRPPGMPWRAVIDDGGLDLLEREDQILRSISQGLSNDETASSIGLTEAAVAAFIENIFLKLHAQNIASVISSKS
jgi:two-component system, NarL family, nitrate/nitrite response regulator NarL